MEKRERGPCQGREASREELKRKEMLKERKEKIQGEQWQDNVKMI